MHKNTQNLADFGNIERDEAALLLVTLNGRNDKTKHFGSNGVVVEFNPYSGMVFLVDEDYNVAVMNDGKLEDFITCPNCGNEDVASEFKKNNEDVCCIEYSENLGL
jgi:hypothetical protein